MARKLVLLLGLAVLPGAAQELRDTAGAVHRPADWAAKRVVVLFFVMPDCPLSNGYVPEMNRIRADYEKQGIAFYAVQTDPTASEAEVRQHAKEFGFTFPVLLDPKNTLARRTGATIVPQAAVLSSKGAVAYLGRIDNRVEDFNRRRPAATVPELRNALDAVLAGRAPEASRTRAVGCAIPLELP